MGILRMITVVDIHKHGVHIILT